MIISEIIENGIRIRHYSDGGFRILQNETGIVYDDAVDVLPCKYTYTETDKPIETSCTDVENVEGWNEIDSGVDEATETDYQNALEDLGVNFNEENNIE